MCLCVLACARSYRANYNEVGILCSNTCSRAFSQYRLRAFLLPALLVSVLPQARLLVLQGQPHVSFSALSSVQEPASSPQPFVSPASSVLQTAAWRAWQLPKPSREPGSETGSWP